MRACIEHNNENKNIQTKLFCTKACTIFLVLFVVVFVVFPNIDGFSQDLNSTELVPKEYATLPTSFMEIALKDTKEIVIEKLKKNDMFVYRGEPDVSFLPSSRNQILRVPGRKFLKQAIFQFDKDNTLIVMILNLRLLDYFTVYTTYQKKYGRAHKISPKTSQWSDSNVKIIIEKPLRVKFLLLNEQLKNKSSEGVKYEKQKRKNREEFLSLF